MRPTENLLRTGMMDLTLTQVTSATPRVDSATASCAAVPDSDPGLSSFGAWTAGRHARVGSSSACCGQVSVVCRAVGWRNRAGRVPAPGRCHPERCQCGRSHSHIATDDARVSRRRRRCPAGQGPWPSRWQPQPAWRAVREPRRRPKGRRPVTQPSRDQMLAQSARPSLRIRRARAQVCCRRSHSRYLASSPSGDVLTDTVTDPLPGLPP